MGYLAVDHDPKFMTPQELARVMGDDDADMEIPIPADITDNV